MIDDALSGFGFSPSEIKVYTYLMRRGGSYANRISSETGINRSNVYEALDRLVEKGVASFVSRNKAKWYKASSTESLHSLLKIRELEFNSQKEAFLKGIKEIRNLTPQETSKTDAGIFTGKDGLKMLFEEMLAVGKPISFFASQLQFQKFFGEYYTQWHKRRAGKKIMQRTIFSENTRKEVLRNYPQPMRKSKFVDGKFMSPTTTVIYGDVVALISWAQEPVAIRIQSKEIAKSHLNYFNLIWKS